MCRKPVFAHTVMFGCFIADRISSNANASLSTANPSLLYIKTITDRRCYLIIAASTNHSRLLAVQSVLMIRCCSLAYTVFVLYYIVEWKLYDIVNQAHGSFPLAIV